MRLIIFSIKIILLIFFLILSFFFRKCEGGGKGTSDQKTDSVFEVAEKILIKKKIMKIFVHIDPVPPKRGEKGKKGEKGGRGPRIKKRIAFLRSRKKY